MPRILCLHGGGTSAAIFKSQTAAFRAKFDKSYVFDFVDAPFPAAVAPGIDAFYKVGTYSWYPHPTAEAIRAAHKWLGDYARNNGPYDAVCGFSMGTSLAASMALYHAVGVANNGGRMLTSEQPLPFRAAIFICGGLPLPVLEDLGLEVTSRAQEIHLQTAKQLLSTAGQLRHYAAKPELIKPGVGLWDCLDGELLHDPKVRPDRRDVFGLDFTSFPTSARIKIPTVHIYGAKDPRWPSGIQLAEFCDDKVEFDHGGGHDIPRSTAVSNKIADMIKQVISRAQRVEDKLQKRQLGLRESIDLGLGSSALSAQWMHSVSPLDTADSWR